MSNVQSGPIEPPCANNVVVEPSNGNSTCLLDQMLNLISNLIDTLNNTTHQCSSTCNCETSNASALVSSNGLGNLTLSTNSSSSAANSYSEGSSSVTLKNETITIDAASNAIANATYVCGEGKSCQLVLHILLIELLKDQVPNFTIIIFRHNPICRNNNRIRNHNRKFYPHNFIRHHHN